MRSLRSRALLLSLLLLALAAPAAADDLGGLRVLLTNDDGFDAPGIAAMREALEKAGYEVLVVAPRGEQSGTSVSLTMRGSIAWKREGPRLWVVDGTPADCVRLALNVLIPGRVDLVVSGVNFGQNVGSGTMHSGTVGAAMTAALAGVPGVAISQTVDANDLQGTVRYFPDAAAFAAQVVLGLESGGRPLLPTGVILNLNHPPRTRGELEGVALTRQGATTLYSLVYRMRDDGRVSMAFSPSTTRETVRNADTSALRAGFATITPLDGSWTVSEPLLATLKALLPRVEAFRGGARKKEE